MEREESAEAMWKIFPIKKYDPVNWNLNWILTLHYNLSTKQHDQSHSIENNILKRLKPFDLVDLKLQRYTLWKVLKFQNS